MKLFNRRKKVNLDLPPEVQAYSQAERRERMGMAWLVGIVSLIVTLLLIAGLFFGGRWVYRKLAHKDKPVPVMTTDNKGKTEEQNDKDKKPEDTKKNSSSNTTDNSGDTEQSPSSSTSTNNSPGQTPTTQPATGDTLPNTGPDVDL